MNSKTAKLLNRVARVNASLSVKNMEQNEQTTIFRKEINDRLQRRLKAQWLGTPKKDRGALRNQLKHAVRNGKHALSKGS